MIQFSLMGLPKKVHMRKILKEQLICHVITGNNCFEGLNFMNDQHTQTLWNFRTSNKPTIQ